MMRALLAKRALLRTDIGVALTTGRTPQGMLQRCAEALVQHLGAAFARIFEPFFTTKADGMGIGLSISRTIISQWDGATLGDAECPARYDALVDPPESPALPAGQLRRKASCGSFGAASGQRAGTRCFNSSCQFWTTTMRRPAADASLAESGSSMRNRCPSGATSYCGRGEPVAAM